MTKDLADLARSDVFDSRDVDERIKKLENDLEYRAVLDPDDAEAEDTQSMKDELKTLTEFRDEVGSGEYKYGMTFIADSHFKEYAEQVAEDIGAIDRDAAWPLSYIDWDAAADALKMDYSSITLDDYEFWYRS